MLYEAVCILWAGELLAEVGETKSGVDALLQDAAKPFSTLQDDDFILFNAVVTGGKGSCHAGRAAADHDKIVVQNFIHGLFRPFVDDLGVAAELCDVTDGLIELFRKDLHNF